MDVVEHSTDAHPGVVIKKPVCRFCGAMCSTTDRGRYICDDCGTAQHKPLWV